MNPYHVEISKLRANHAALHANILRQKTQYLDLEKNKSSLMDNMRASQRSMRELEQQIAGLVEAHGEPPYVTLDELEGLSDGL